MRAEKLNDLQLGHQTAAILMIGSSGRCKCILKGMCFCWCPSLCSVCLREFGSEVGVEGMPSRAALVSADAIPIPNPCVYVGWDADNVVGVVHLRLLTHGTDLLSTTV